MGAQLARTMGGWQVICWALVISVPFLLPSLYTAIATHGFSPGADSFAGFVYLSAVSMLLAFFVWYKGLALGGTAKVAQVQLLQPFLTLFASALILGEQLAPETLLTAGSVVVVVFLAQMTRLRNPALPVAAPVQGLRNTPQN